MSREKADFRDNLERLNEVFPDKECLTKGEVTAFMGFKRTETTVKYVDFGNRSWITKASLARQLCIRD